MLMRSFMLSFLLKSFESRSVEKVHGFFQKILNLFWIAGKSLQTRAEGKKGHIVQLGIDRFQVRRQNPRFVPRAF
jgi:hypothetical protein